MIDLLSFMFLGLTLVHSYAHCHRLFIIEYLNHLFDLIQMATILQCIDVAQGLHAVLLYFAKKILLEYNTQNKAFNFFN